MGPIHLSKRMIAERNAHIDPQCGCISGPKYVSVRGMTAERNAHVGQ
jgi:hypothetical protein